jgi:hypothetical protein
MEADWMNRKKVQKTLLISLASVTPLAFGGCLGVDLNRVLGYGAFYATSEFLFDNDGVFDLFESGGVAGDAG